MPPKLSRHIDMEELVRLKTFKERAEYLVNAWIRARPDDYAEFCRICERERAALKLETGMSDGGQFAYKGQIPTELYIVMHNIEPQFGHNPTLISQVQEMVMPKNTLPDLKKVTQFNDFSNYEDDNGRQATTDNKPAGTDIHMLDWQERKKERANLAQEPRADTGAP